MKLINEDVRLKKSQLKRVLTGSILIAFAGILFADNFGILPIEWSQYIYTWQMLLIAIGLVFIVKRGSRSTGIILMGIGGYFLAEKIFGYQYDFRHLLLPSMLALIGVLFIFRKKKHRIFSEE